MWEKWRISFFRNPFLLKVIHHFWTMHEIPVGSVTEKAAALYFEYRGNGALQFEGFELVR